MDYYALPVQFPRRELVFGAEPSSLLHDWASKDDYSMRLDAYDKTDHYLIEVEMAGFDRKDIRLNYTEGYLVINAKKRENKEHLGQAIYRERFYGDITRKLYLPDVDEDHIKAKYEDGILRIYLQKIDDNVIKDRKIIVE